MILKTLDGIHYTLMRVYVGGIVTNTRVYNIVNEIADIDIIGDGCFIRNFGEKQYLLVRIKYPDIFSCNEVRL